jgi:hypothetical protein
LSGPVVSRALRAPALRRPYTTSHLDAFPVDECISDLPARVMQVAPGSLSGNAHPCGSFFLFESLKVDEPYQLELLGP